MNSVKTPQTQAPAAPIFSRGAGLKALGFAGRLVLAFIGFVLISESLVRLPVFNAISPYRSLGLWYYPFDIKWYRLEKYIQQHGGVDVILLGSSLVNTGLIPEEISQAYQAETGTGLRVFNFGIDGMTIAPNSEAAKILVEKYQPQLLIFVTEIRDYDDGNGLRVQDEFLTNHWIRYQMGFWDFNGWIIDHSRALQHYLVYRNWTSTQFSSTLNAYFGKLEDVTESGYEPDNADASRFDPETNILAPFPLAEARLANLRTLLGLGKSGQTQIMIMEMPVDPRIYQAMGGAAAQQAFRETVSQVVQEGGGIFLPADDTLIPVSGRSNPQHLNIQGAPILSAFLGKQMANLTLQQVLQFQNLP